MGCVVQGYRTSGEQPVLQPSLNGAAMLGQASGLNSMRWVPGCSTAWLLHAVGRTCLSMLESELAVCPIRICTWSPAALVGTWSSETVCASGLEVGVLLLQTFGGSHVMLGTARLGIDIALLQGWLHGPQHSCPLSSFAAQAAAAHGAAGVQQHGCACASKPHRPGAQRQ